jgi:transcriptional regulator with PAS, ATPase and Fis domain
MTLRDLQPLLGTSPAMRLATELINRYAATRLPILIVGPTGTGKELVARHIHARSGRPGRFVPVNCAALPREMAESLLFGHRRGAFSGAVESRQGYFECAHQGTLFLDELLCLPSDGQGKLLRALDTGEIQPLGEQAERFVEARVVAAVQDEVWTDLERGSLRSDLYQRVAGIVIVLPPLAERPEDIVPIARYFTEQSGRVLETGAVEVLTQYPWPGNVRELLQVIERAGQLVTNGTLPPGALAESIHLGARPAQARVWRQDLAERDTLLATCQVHAWDAERIARAMGLSRSQLYRRLRTAGIALRAMRKSRLSRR